MQISPRPDTDHSSGLWCDPKSLPMGLCALVLTGIFFVLSMDAEAREARPFSAEFSLEGSNGYLVSVIGGHHEVVINVSKNGLQSGHLEETAYTIPGAVSKDRIEANLGDLGEISLRFSPSGEVITKKRPKPPNDCTAPRKIVRRQGTFVGFIRFEGEGGYTTVDATEVSGSIGTPEGIFCASFINGSAKEGHHRHVHVPPPAPFLDATTVHNALAFAAAAVGRHRHRASFVASSTEKDGAVSIVRWASVVASRSDFRFNRRLTAASVTPPPPFSGAATFRRPRKGGLASWTGSLTVSFPGASEIPLTGPNFTTTLLASFSPR